MSPASPAPQREVIIFPDGNAIARRAAEEFLQTANDAVAQCNAFTVALAGGSTPKALYSLLATDPAFRDKLPWDRIHFFFGDERHVPPDHADSNYRMVNESLLSKIQLPPENIFRVKAENADANAAALDYERQMRSFFSPQGAAFPRFDLILLGLGPDGHTASLFPGSLGLQEQSRWFIANRVEKFQTDRLTVTFPVLNNSAEVIFLASGPDKAEIVRRVLESKNDGKTADPYPSQRVRPADGRLLWMLDEPAAAKLGRSRDTGNSGA